MRDLAGNLRTPEGGRLGAMQGVYYRMSEEAFCRCAGLIDANGTVNLDDRLWSEDEADRDRQSVTAAIECIVFAGMCLEAAIFDYAAWHLPDGVVMGLDRLDFLTKWQLVPLLITGTELPAGQHARNALKTLNGIRNQLVHAKSAPMRHGADLIAQLDGARKRETAVRFGHVEAMKAIIYCSLELDRISPETINPLPHFNPPEDTRWDFLPPDYPPPVQRIVGACRANLKRSRNAGGRRPAASATRTRLACEHYGYGAARQAI